MCLILSPLCAVLGMQPPLPPEAVRELVCSCLHRDPVAADLRCSLFVAAAQNYKRDSLLRPFPPRYISSDNKDFEELVRYTVQYSDSQKLLNTLCCRINAYMSSNAVILIFKFRYYNYTTQTVSELRKKVIFISLERTHSFISEVWG